VQGAVSTFEKGEIVAFSENYDDLIAVCGVALAEYLAGFQPCLKPIVAGPD